MKWITFRAIRDLYEKNDYLLRWSLWLPLGASLKVHKIVRNDDDRCEHDHPWWFIRVILWGGYTESVNGKMFVRRPWRPWAFWRVYPCLPSFRHRITDLTKGVNWSLVLCGPHNLPWGFYTKKGWILWSEFIKMATSARILWCDDRRLK